MSVSLVKLYRLPFVASDVVPDFPTVSRMSALWGAVAWVQANDASALGNVDVIGGGATLARALFDNARRIVPAARTSYGSGERAIHAAGAPVLAYGYDAVLGERIDAETARVETLEQSSAQGESWETLSGSETVSGALVTVTRRVRLTIGSGTYAPGEATVTGELTELKALRAQALSAARGIRDKATGTYPVGSARRARADVRSSERVIGSSATPAVSLRRLPDGMPGAAGVTVDDYRALRGFVMRHAYGNAQRASGSRSATEYVKAGYVTSGVSVDSWAIDDAVQESALWVIRWLTDGLPEHLAQILERIDAESSDDDAAAGRKRAVLLSAAAQNGLRDVTRQPRNAEVSRARAYADRLGAEDSPRTPTVTRERVIGSQATFGVSLVKGVTSRPVIAQVVNGGAPVGRPARHGKRYVTSGVPGADLMSAVFARNAAGALRYPVLAALALSGSGGRAESVADVAQALYGNAGGAARKRVREAARAEFDAARDALLLDVAAPERPVSGDALSDA